MNTDLLQLGIFEQAGDVVLLCDSAGRFLKANRAARVSLNLSIEELQQLELDDIVAVSSGANCLLQAGQHTTSFQRKDGSCFPVEVQVSRFAVSPQEGLLLVARDISVRRDKEVELQEQNNLLTNILANIPHSIYWKDCNLAYVGCNENFAHDVGLQSAGQLVGRTVYDLPHLNDVADFIQQCDQEVISKGYPLLDFEEQRHRPDGSFATLLSSRVPLTDASGQVSGLLGIYTDMTERRLAEVALEKSELRHKNVSREFQTVLNGIQDSLMLLTPDLQVVWANRATADQLGRDFESIPGSYCYQLWDTADKSCSDCIAQQSFQSGQPAESVRQQPDGRIWGIKTFPIKDNQGRVINVVHLASDITEKKKLREEADRAGRLAALGELSAGVAHEINNPNGLFLLNLPLLEDAFSDAQTILDHYLQENGDFELAGLPYRQLRDDIPQMFNSMTDGALRIREIVNDLKDFVRKDPRETQQPFDVGVSVGKVVRMADNVIKKSTHRFTCRIEDDLPLAKGHAAQIEQVILNLLLNACNAVKDQQAEIELRAKADAAGENLVVELHDHGCGIAESDLPHVTDPFFTTRREQGGTGLGLSIAARIVSEHKGSLRFDSELGVGTKVSLILPAVTGAR